MSIQNQLFTLLSGGATLAGARIYPLTAPDGVVRPYITYQRIFSNSENVLSGSTNLFNTRMQIDMYALIYFDAISLAAQVDSLMSSWIVQNVSLLSRDFYEDAVKLFRVSVDYSIWH
ncbi:DUF3168 domain-containing protein [Glaciimonas sp. PCH181]|uniref:DUF3168 domain-containing protein n=1 Tax=Glaciimonas sp. PCH181 TaxID=2133943 RepID=UPI000D33E21C|nr:DUF3168 domain-containing protein [Glaciimonas sp. PCH181]PUA17265.1 hypothetical protein C7W93_15140 [Glaciimonas sp. PCH181]